MQSEFSDKVYPVGGERGDGSCSDGRQHIRDLQSPGQSLPASSPPNFPTTTNPSVTNMSEICFEPFNAWYPNYTTPGYSHHAGQHNSSESNAAVPSLLDGQMFVPSRTSISPVMTPDAAWIPASPFTSAPVSSSYPSPVVQPPFSYSYPWTNPSMSISSSLPTTLAQPDSSPPGSTFQPLGPIDPYGPSHHMAVGSTLPRPLPSSIQPHDVVPSTQIRPGRRRPKSESIRTRSKSGTRDINKSRRPSQHRPEPVRDQPACWRCRRYKKPCNGPGDCANCLKGGFRVWPRRLVCRRGCLEDQIPPILPAQSAEILGPAARIFFRQPNWRKRMVDEELQRIIQERLPSSNRWECIDLKVQSTGIFGEEFSSLLQILVTYQQAQSKPSSLLDNSITLLESCCDVYQNFVESAWPLPAPEVTVAIANAQRAYANVCKMFLTSALSGRARDWLPSFLSMGMTLVSVMIIMDTAVAVPQRQREQVWGDLNALSRNLRVVLFPVTSDLLRASSNGTKPFGLGCWTITPTTPKGAESEGGDGASAVESGEPVRNPAGMKMLENDEAAFDGMMALQDWIKQHIGLLNQGPNAFDNDPLMNPQVPCITPVLKLFDSEL